MGEGEKDSGFTVKDRRRFDATGEAREESEESIDAEREHEERVAHERERRDATADSTAAAGQHEPSDSASIDPSAPERGPRAGELSFSGFVIGLAQQAFMFLGVIPDPHSAVAHKDLAQARAMIDIIEMLKEKTKGNLDEIEERMMEEMLEELHLQYVREFRASMPTEGGNS